MKRILQFGLFTVILSMNNYTLGQSWNISLGGNYSKFIDASTSLTPGITFGIGRSISILENLDVMLEVNYSNHKGVIQKKSITNLSSDFIDDDVDYHDIHCSFSRLGFTGNIYHEIPLSGKVHVRFSLGVAVQFIIRDQSEKKRLYSTPIPYEGFKQDYRLTSMDENSASSISRLTPVFGLEFWWTTWALGVNYHRIKFNWFSYVYINDNLDIFRFYLKKSF